MGVLDYTTLAKDQTTFLFFGCIDDDVVAERIAIGMIVDMRPSIYIEEDLNL